MKKMNLLLFQISSVIRETLKDDQQVLFSALTGRPNEISQYEKIPFYKKKCIQTLKIN